MQLKHINFVLKLIRHINLNQNQKKLTFRYQKEFLPFLEFILQKGLIHKYIFFKRKYIIIFFKSIYSISFLKKIKIFNFKKHEFKKYIKLIFLKQQNMFKYCVVVTNFGIFNLEVAIQNKLGGVLIAQIN